MAVLGDEARVGGDLDEGGPDAGAIEELEDFGVGGVADGGFALEFVGFDAVSGGDAVLALQKTQGRVVC